MKFFLKTLLKTLLACLISIAPVCYSQPVETLERRDLIATANSYLDNYSNRYSNPIYISYAEEIASELNQSGKIGSELNILNAKIALKKALNPVNKNQKSDLIKLSRSFIDKALGTNPRDASAHLFSAYLSLVERDKEKLEQSLRNFEQLDPSSNHLKLIRAQEAFLSKKPEVATRIAEEVISQTKVRKEITEATKIIAQSAVASSNLKKASHAFELLRKLKPEDDGILIFYFKLLDKNKEYDKAIALATEFLETRKNKTLSLYLSETYYRLGSEAFSQENTSEKAKEFFEKSIYFNKDSAKSNSGLAAIEYNKFLNDKENRNLLIAAKRSIDKALKTEPNNAFIEDLNKRINYYLNPSSREAYNSRELEEIGFKDLESSENIERLEEIE